MEAFCCGCVGFSSIRRLENRRHSESRSTIEVEGELEEVAGKRRHSTDPSPGGGRSGGGYVVGNA